jgi:hypothetical protein
MLLLGRRVLLDPALLVGHPEVPESRPGTGHPRLARHDLLVHRRGEPLGGPGGAVPDVTPFALHQVLEGLAPGQFVGRVDQHPVHVEDRASVRHEPLLLLEILICGVILRPARRAGRPGCRPGRPAIRPGSRGAGPRLPHPPWRTRGATPGRGGAGCTTWVTRTREAAASTAAVLTAVMRMSTPTTGPGSVIGPADSWSPREWSCRSLRRSGPGSPAGQAACPQVARWRSGSAQPEQILAGSQRRLRLHR